MKENLFFLIIFITISCAAQAQDTSYFPHAVGNTWVYVYDDGRIEKQVITSDSVDQLGNRFICINNESRYSYKWLYKVSSNMDSIFYLPTGINDLIYRFPITGKSDKWMVKPERKIATVFGTYTASVLGKITDAIDIRYYSFRVENGDTILDFRTWERNEIIARGFGLVWEGIEVEYKVLVGCIINGDTLGFIPTTGLSGEKSIVPEGFELYQNYPNPFNPRTVISFSLPSYSKVELTIFDMFGRKIKTLADEYMGQGKHSFIFDADNISSGLYFYKLKAGKSSIIKKMLYLK